MGGVGETQIDGGADFGQGSVGADGQHMEEVAAMIGWIRIQALSPTIPTSEGYP